MVLARNTDWRVTELGLGPGVDQIELRAVASPGERLDLLRAGTVQVADLTVTQLSAVRSGPLPTTLREARIRSESSGGCAGSRLPSPRRRSMRRGSPASTPAEYALFRHLSPAVVGTKFGRSCPGDRRIAGMTSHPPFRAIFRAVAATALALSGALFVADQAAAATPAHVQSRAQEITSGTANNLAFSANNTAGNLIVVYALWSNTQPVTLTDTAGNSYLPAAPATKWNNSAWSSQVFYAKSVAGGANTVRATFAQSISSFGILYIHEYSGVDTANPLDASAAAIGSSQAMDSGSAAVTGSNDLIFGAGASSYSVNQAGTGFTTRRIDFDNRTEDKVVTGTGSYNATARQSGSAWVMHMVAFKAAGGSTDSTPPTVAITAPNNGANVSDITQVTANANDNVGVAGVRFLVDGQPEGAEDTSAPYGLSWDTRAVGNGAHTLTARARDAAGNTTTSAPIAVNVANSDYFQNEVLATGFNLPTTFEFLPDGRLLVAELAGRIKVLSPPYTQADPGLFLQITNIGSAGVQQGIYDLVLDPNFAANHFYYVFYTLGSPNHDRVSRFTANASLTGTVAGSEFVLYEDPQNADAEHHGGALSFANDGKLMFTTGEHFQPQVSQSLTSPRGKVHRINPDGTIPTDNPFYDGSGPNIDSIWARGLRNPYRAYFDAPTGRYFIGDVGGNDASTAIEELDMGVRGANYGWPDSEGPCAPPCQSPLLSYAHNGRDAAITGGFVYHGTKFPSFYRGAYFYADYTQNWIRGIRLDASGAITDRFNFEPSNGSVDGPYGDIVYLDEGPDGALYYLDLGYSDIGGTFGVSKLRRIKYVQSNQAPVVSASANPTSGSTPLNVAFSSSGSSDPEGQALTYSWNFGDGQTSTAANPSHTYTSRGDLSGAAHRLRRRQRFDLDPDRDQRRRRSLGDDLLADRRLQLPGGRRDLLLGRRHRSRRRPASRRRVYVEHRLPARRPRPSRNAGDRRPERQLHDSHLGARLQRQHPLSDHADGDGLDRPHRHQVGDGLPGEGQPQLQQRAQRANALRGRDRQGDAIRARHAGRVHAYGRSAQSDRREHVLHVRVVVRRRRSAAHDHCPELTPELHRDLQFDRGPDGLGGRVGIQRGRGRDRQRRLGQR